MPPTRPKPDLSGRIAQAIFKGDLREVRKVFSLEPDVDLNISLGEEYEFRSPLLFALSQRKYKLVKLLVSLGADCNHVVELEDQTRFIPLREALLCKNVEIFELLLSHGADARVLVYSSFLGAEQTLLFDLLRVKSMPTADFERVFDLLVDHGCDVNFVLPWSHETVMHRIARNGPINCLKKLLSLGIPVDKRNKESRTPLMEVTRVNICNTSDQNLKERIELLIHHGANVNAVDSAGKSPLYYSSVILKGVNYDSFYRYDEFYKIMFDVCEVLLENGACAGDGQGHIALLLAIQLNRPDIVNLLIKAGCEVYFKTSMQMKKTLAAIRHSCQETPLLQSLKFRRFDIIKILVQAGYNVQADSEMMKTPEYKVILDECSSELEWLKGIDISRPPRLLDLSAVNGDANALSGKRVNSKSRETML